jgi:peptidyl-prolyl cis-trans isomerase B (cyclophilin B)
LENFKLIDDIAAVKKDEFNRPLEDVKMIITAKKLRKKKITRLYRFQYEKKK